MKRVGVLVGREDSFPKALIAELFRRDSGVFGELAVVDLEDVSRPLSYDVLVDRISHEVPCFQPVLKVAAVAGVPVVNNPFWRIADDKAVGTAIVERCGIAVPKTFVLPSKAYGPDITAGSLRNLAFPLRWPNLVEELGFPMYLKPHWGGGFRNVFRVESLPELMKTYDGTGDLTMIAQEAIEWSQYVRCVVIGRTEVLALPWDPRLPHAERYALAGQSMAPLSAELLTQVETQSRLICDALGYEMNTCEFAIRDGVPYAIDFMNSAPDFDITSLGEASFSWVVGKMADLVSRLAAHPNSVHYRWDALLAGR